MLPHAQSLAQTRPRRRLPDVTTFFRTLPNSFELQRNSLKNSKTPSKPPPSSQCAPWHKSAKETVTGAAKSESIQANRTWSSHGRIPNAIKAPSVRESAYLHEKGVPKARSGAKKPRAGINRELIQSAPRKGRRARSFGGADGCASGVGHQSVRSVSAARSGE